MCVCKDPKRWWWSRLQTDLKIDKVASNENVFAVFNRAVKKYGPCSIRGNRRRLRHGVQKLDGHEEEKKNKYTSCHGRPFIKHEFARFDEYFRLATSRRAQTLFFSIFCKNIFYTPLSETMQTLAVQRLRHIVRDEWMRWSVDFCFRRAFVQIGIIAR